MQQALPLAGFSVIDAENVEEVIELVSNTEAARVRPFALDAVARPLMLDVMR